MCIDCTIVCPCDQCIARPREGIALVSTFRKIRFCDEVSSNPANHASRDSAGVAEVVRYCWPGKAIPWEASVGRPWTEEHGAEMLSAFCPVAGMRFVEDAAVVWFG